MIAVGQAEHYASAHRTTDQFDAAEILLREEILDGIGEGGHGDFICQRWASPNPGRSMAITVRSRARAGTTRSQLCRFEVPWTSRSGLPASVRTDCIPNAYPGSNGRADTDVGAAERP